MNKHTVFVAGKRFVLLSDDEDKYIQRLAEEVTKTITKIAAENPTLDRRGSAILCALDYADDKYKEIAHSRRLSDNAKPLIAQADKQAKQIRELKEQTSQRDRLISDYKSELEALRASDRQQKEQLKKLTDTLDIREAELREVRAQLEDMKREFASLKEPRENVKKDAQKKDAVKKDAPKKDAMKISAEDEKLEDQLFSLFDND